MGKKIDKFSLPVCNSFKAKILNDQLCYELDVNEVIDRDILVKDIGKVGSRVTSIMQTYSCIFFLFNSIIAS